MAKPMTAAETLAAMKLWKVPYREYHGWQTRGRDPEHGAWGPVNGIVIHHTGSDSQSDGYLQFLAVDGRGDLPAPLCNVSTDMDGDLWLIAQGRANHAGKGSGTILSEVIGEDYPGYTTELHAGPDNTDGNAHFYGNEVRYDGGQPMTSQQWATATRWAAAVCHHHGWSALSIVGHREWTRRKPDPGNCPMNQFRAAVAALLKAGPPSTAPVTKPPVKPPVEDDMPYTEAQLRAMMQAENEEYGGRLWGQPTGTGTKFMASTKAQFDDLNAKVDALAADVRALAAALLKPNA